MKTLYLAIFIGISGIIIALSMTYFSLYYSSTFSGTMNVADANFSVNYTATNAKILSMAYFDFRTSSNYPHAIVIKAQPRGDWHLTITMPVSIFGNNTDTKAGALSSGNTIFVNMDKKTATSATYSFNFTESDNQVTIFYPSQLP